MENKLYWQYWHDVTQPQPSDEIVLATDGVSHIIGKVYYDNLYQTWACDDKEGNRILLNITHWMFLPEPLRRKDL